VLPCAAQALLDYLLCSDDVLSEGDDDDDDDDDDAAVWDKKSDIKPHHYRGESHGFDYKDDNSFDNEIDDDDLGNEMLAVAALDILAVHFSPDLLNAMLEPPKNKLWNTDHLQSLQCKSTVLVFGAITKGNV
jgi:hypothetical protein